MPWYACPRPVCATKFKTIVESWEKVKTPPCPNCQTPSPRIETPKKQWKKKSPETHFYKQYVGRT
jgi:hypothetical protein